MTFEIKLIVAPLSRSNRTECPSIRRRTYHRSPLGVFSVSSSSSGSSSRSSSQTSDLLRVDRGRVERHTDPKCDFWNSDDTFAHMLGIIPAWARGSLRSIYSDSGLPSKVSMLWAASGANAQSARVGAPGRVLAQPLHVVAGLPTRWLCRCRWLFAGSSP